MSSHEVLESLEINACSSVLLALVSSTQKLLEFPRILLPLCRFLTVLIIHKACFGNFMKFLL